MLVFAKFVAVLHYSIA